MKYVDLKLEVLEIKQIPLMAYVIRGYLTRTLYLCLQTFYKQRF